MKGTSIYKLLLAFVFAGLISLSFLERGAEKAVKLKFPYKQAGLTEKQAAVHLLNRFTYGPKPGQLEEVLKQGPEKWFAGQLRGDLDETYLNSILQQYDVLRMSEEQILNTFPNSGQVVRLAIKDGLIHQDSLAVSGRATYQQMLRTYMDQKGYRPQQEMYRQLISQKILRAAYGNNQLQEVLTDFWFNHFNVSLTKNQCAEYVLPYERDVIRPNVFNRFSDLLIATAKSPAMLFYLDNFSSSGALPDRPALEANMQVMEREMKRKGDSLGLKRIEQQTKNRKAQGLNENYAREVMELHTLGVDGGYSQDDVTQAARVLTGWTVYPLGDRAAGSQIVKQLERLGAENLQKKGYVREGSFLFLPARHDNGEKVVLGQKFAGEGYQEGVKLLNMLARHPATARFISRKLAVRFVSDNPPESLITKMAKTFQEKDGDIREVLITMVTAPEFWSKEAIREKTKSPFELAISTVRSLDAKIEQPYQLFSWINRMGQRIYYYQAPTGFPDRGQYWINTGALLNRMNFGLAVSSGRIPGIKVDLLQLNKNHEPESAESALIKYSSLILPERDLDETIKRLKPMLNDPKLGDKVEAAAAKASKAENQAMMQSEMLAHEEQSMELRSGRKPAQQTGPNKTMLAQVVGVIIGSPEFQRR